MFFVVLLHRIQCILNPNFVTIQTIQIATILENNLLQTYVQGTKPPFTTT